MKDTKVIRHSPDKNNLYYSVEKCSDIEEAFQPMIKVLNENTVDIPKTRIYGQSLKDCGEIYSLFDSPQVGMYHSQTSEKIKERVLK